MTKNEFLEKLRKDLGYSRKKIGEMLEVSPSTIEKYEKGRLEFNYTTKYVLGICALSGYDNHIFNLSKIDKLSTYEYKLTKFSTQLKKILYFLNIDYDLYDKFIEKILRQVPLIEFNDNELFDRWSIKEYLLNQNFYIQEETIKFIKNPTEVKKELENIDDKEFFKNIPKEKFILDEIKQLEENKIEFFTSLRIEALLLYSFNFFNIKEFYEEEKYSFLKQILKDKNTFLKDFKQIAPIGVTPLLWEDEDKKYLSNQFLNIKKRLEILELKGKPVTKETIKEFKIELETGAILSTATQPTDPKDKKICELLKYAPPAFKDKIIEKLEKFRDEVEDI